MLTEVIYFDYGIEHIRAGYGIEWTAQDGEAVSMATNARSAIKFGSGFSENDNLGYSNVDYRKIDEDAFDWDYYEANINNANLFASVRYAMAIDEDAGDYIKTTDGSLLEPDYLQKDEFMIDELEFMKQLIPTIGWLHPNQKYSDLETIKYSIEQSRVNS